MVRLLKDRCKPEIQLAHQPAQGITLGFILLHRKTSAFRPRISGALCVLPNVVVVLDSQFGQDYWNIGFTSAIPECTSKGVLLQALFRS